SYSPTSADIGASVTITGTNFNTTAASNTVKFGGSSGTAATVTAATATSLTVTVPAGVTSNPAPVYVSNSYGNVTGAGFTINAPPITSFTPVKQVTGSSITITGTNFQTTPAANTVLFTGSGGAAGAVTAATTTSLTVTVPANATPGKIYVSNVYGNST